MRDIDGNRANRARYEHTYGTACCTSVEHAIISSVTNVNQKLSLTNRIQECKACVQLFGVVQYHGCIHFDANLPDSSLRVRRA